MGAVDVVGVAVVVLDAPPPPCEPTVELTVGATVDATVGVVCSTVCTPSLDLPPPLEVPEVFKNSEALI